MTYTYKNTFRPLFAYGLFLLIAAPLEFNLSAYFNGMSEALLTGFLYSFAVLPARNAPWCSVWARGR